MTAPFTSSPWSVGFLVRLSDKCVPSVCSAHLSLLPVGLKTLHLLQERAANILCLSQGLLHGTGLVRDGEVIFNVLDSMGNSFNVLLQLCMESEGLPSMVSTMQVPPRFSRAKTYPMQISHRTEKSCSPEPPPDNYRYDGTLLSLPI